MRGATILNHKRLILIETEKPPIQSLQDDGVRPPRSHWLAEIRDESGGEAFVAVMQTTDLRDGDHLSDPAWHDRAWLRTILGVFGPEWNFQRTHF